MIAAIVMLMIQAFHIKRRLSVETGRQNFADVDGPKAELAAAKPILYLVQN